MNRLQQKILDLLKNFISICQKNGLTYFLVCGSALGAVKYKGFIPWDDDIDVGMPRKDYDIFVNKAQELLPENIFLQNYRTDKEFPHVFSKLRDSSTTLIEKGVAHLNMHHGIYIDVFPIDGYPQDKNEQKNLNKKKKFLTWKQYCALKDKSNWKVRLRNPFFRLLGYHKRTTKTLATMEALISQYDTEKSEVWCNHGNWGGMLEYAPKWHYGKGIQAEFEGVKVIIPENYDAYLTQKYGNWRKDPPAEKMVSHHKFVICDLDRPYTEYIKIRDNSLESQVNF